MQTFNLNKLGLSLLVSSLLTINSYGNILGGIASDAISSEVSFDLLGSSIASGEVNTNSQTVYDKAETTVSEFGGEYSKQTKDILGECFNENLPDWDFSFDIPGGLDFCGIEAVAEIAEDVYKKSKTGVIGKSKSKIKPAGKKNNIRPKTDNEVDKEKKQQKINLDILDSMALGEENGIVSGDYGDGSSENILTDLKKIGTLTKTQKENRIIEANPDIFINPSSKDVIKNNLKTLASENLISNSESLVNHIKTNEFNYYKYFYPNKLIVDDDNKKSVYTDLAPLKLIKDAINQEVQSPGNYYTNITTDNNGIETAIELNIRDFKEYKNIKKDYIKNIEDLSDNKINGSSLLNNFGGVTPIATSFEGFLTYKKHVADTLINSNGKDTGAHGRELAQIKGLEGVMYQLLTVNQSIDKLTRLEYDNNQINNFKEINSNLDRISQSLDIMKEQNKMIIYYLKDIASK